MDPIERLIKKYPANCSIPSLANARGCSKLRIGVQVCTRKIFDHHFFITSNNYEALWFF